MAFEPQAVKKKAAGVMTNAQDVSSIGPVAPGIEFLGQTEDELLSRYPYLLKYDRDMRRKKLWKLAISDWSDRQILEGLTRLPNEPASEEAV